MAFEYLETIGRAKSLFEVGGTSSMEKMLKNFAEMQIELSIEALQNGNPKHFATGSLAQSISYTINTDEIITLDFLMNDYWDFINSGVAGIQNQSQVYDNAFGQEYSFKSLNPSAKMVDAFAGQGGDMMNWMAAKGITQMTYTDAAGNSITDDLITDEDYRSAAFVFARAVKRKGISGNQFIDNVFNDEAIERFQNDFIKLIEQTL